VEEGCCGDSVGVDVCIWCVVVAGRVLVLFRVTVEWSAAVVIFVTLAVVVCCSECLVVVCSSESCVVDL
jgi:hypothetical protein